MNELTEMKWELQGRNTSARQIKYQNVPHGISWLHWLHLKRFPSYLYIQYKKCLLLVSLKENETNDVTQYLQVMKQMFSIFRMGYFGMKLYSINFAFSVFNNC